MSRAIYQNVDWQLSRFIDSSKMWLCWLLKFIVSLGNVIFQDSWKSPCWVDTKITVLEWHQNCNLCLFISQHLVMVALKCQSPSWRRSPASPATRTSVTGSSPSWRSRRTFTSLHVVPTPVSSPVGRQGQFSWLLQELYQPPYMLHNGTGSSRVYWELGV